MTTASIPNTTAAPGVTGTLSVVPGAALAAAAPAAPVTVSGAEMSRLTGVDRERLRTWERRHGFPEPVRMRNDVRRYRVEDVRHVAAVSALAAGGVPLREAIDAVRAGADAGQAIGSLGALDHAPSPAIAISGPAPLTVSWVNGATAMHPDAPQVGADIADALAVFDGVALEAIRELLRTTDAPPTVVAHADWTSTFPSQRRSIAWRLSDTGGMPVVLLMLLPEMTAAKPVFPSRANAAIQQQTATWSSAMVDARRALQTSDGLASIQRSVGAFATGAGAMDGFLVLGSGEQLRVASSARGTVSSRIVARTACTDLVRSVLDLEVDWLSSDSKRALGINPNAAAVVVPLAMSGERLGAAVFTFRAELALGDNARDLLLTYGLATAGALIRERDARPMAAPIRKAA